MYESDLIKHKLGANPGISLGGGNENGRWTSYAITEINQALAAGRFSDYTYYIADIEIGETGLASDFATNFKAAKDAGMTVVVTISHSAPYGFADKIELMESFFKDENIDYISPQMYTTGTETEIDWDYDGVTWDQFSDSIAEIAPSLVDCDQYWEAEAEFAFEYGVFITGCI